MYSKWRIRDSAGRHYLFGVQQSVSLAGNIPHSPSVLVCLFVRSFVRLFVIFTSLWWIDDLYFWMRMVVNTAVLMMVWKQKRRRLLFPPLCPAFTLVFKEFETKSNLALILYCVWQSKIRLFGIALRVNGTRVGFPAIALVHRIHEKFLYYHALNTFAFLNRAENDVNREKAISLHWTNESVWADIYVYIHINK